MAPRFGMGISGSVGEAFEMDLRRWHAQRLQARPDGFHELERATQVDVAIAHVRGQRVEAGGIERVPGISRVPRRPMR